MNKLIKQNLKQNIWLIGCVMLLLILCRPLMQLMQYENVLRFSTLESAVESMEGFFLPSIGNDYIPTFLLSVVIGLVFFSYLFSKKKVDLYHSIPVSRNSLFIASYLSGIIVYLMAVLAQTLLSVIIAASNHYLTALALKNICATVICNLVYFLYGYAITILAVMLTGNIIVSLIGTAVIAGFYPVFMFVILYFYNYFYVTYATCDNVVENMFSKYYWLSPLVGYGIVISDMGYIWNRVVSTVVSFSYVKLVLPLIMTIAITAFAYFLYMRRPSEAAGKTIAFKVSQPIIRIPLVILGGLIGAWFMCSSVNTFRTKWLWLGLLLGVVLSHCILEIIFNESFKALFSHKIQLLCSLAVTMVVVCIFYTDALHFNSYIPNREKIESASVYFEGIDNNLSCVELTASTINPGSYDAIYNGAMEHALKGNYTESSIIDKIYTISNIGISFVENMEDAKKDGYGGSYVPYAAEAYPETFEAVEDVMINDGNFESIDLNTISEDSAYQQALSWMQENDITELKRESKEKNITVDILYILKNGKKVLRKYDIPVSQLKAAMNDVYSTEEFNKNHFDIYNVNELGAITKIDVYDAFENKALTVNMDDKDKLMAAYLSDLKNVSIDTISNMPIGRICPSYKNSFGYDEILSGYYIYPDYKNTLACIAEYLGDMSSFTSELDPAIISTISVSSYNLYGKSEAETYFVDGINYMADENKDIIKELAPLMVNATNIWTNDILINPNTEYDSLGADIMVYLNPKNGIMSNPISVKFKDNKLPEKIKKEIAIKIWLDNQF